MKATEKGIKRIFNAFKYSYSGFISSFKSEEAFRQDLLFCLIFFVIALFLPCDVISKIILIFPLVLIIIMELVNTAIETVVDRISEEYHELSKKAKDIGSLLVLLSFVFRAGVWFFMILSFI
ncbi:MAG: Diacylglycerol kinase [Alphaproteobacteria bacterium ADurb.Bin438]|nr:MAG: Diacylglycerol kinase [Alphaproteobacteria bacterium ADurb.Bin438]